MSVGDRSAFPMFINREDFDPGLTYRQWLIGQALAGAMANNEIPRPMAIAGDVIEVIDAIIDKLDNE